MGKYSIPSNILVHKPSGPYGIKLIGGKYYYVYEKKDVYDSITKRSKVVWGKLVGKITQTEGYVPNGKDLGLREITVKDYGDYNFVLNNSKSVLADLLLYFSHSDAKTIYSLAVINVINGLTHYYQYKRIFDYSYLSNIFSGVHLSENSVSHFLELLGSRTTSSDEFKRKQIENSGSMKFAIDGHVIANHSKTNDLSRFGNKYRTTKSAQFNIMTMMDIVTHVPVMAKAFQGNQLDKMYIKEFLEESNVTKSLLIMDSGFFSHENIHYILEHNSLIIPVAQNLKEYKEITKDCNLTENFLYHRNKTKRIVFYKKTPSRINGCFVYLFIDKNWQDQLMAEYQEEILKGTTGFTQEEFNQCKDLLGSIVLLSDIDCAGKEVFELYKSRWGIETLFDTYKNQLDFQSLGIQGHYQTSGFTFIMLIASQIYQLLLNHKNGLDDSLKNTSLPELLFNLRFIKAQSKNQKWHLNGMTEKEKEVCSSLNVDLPYCENWFLDNFNKTL